MLLSGELNFKRYSIHYIGQLPTYFEIYFKLAAETLQSNTKPRSHAIVCRNSTVIGKSMAYCISSVQIREN